MTAALILYACASILFLVYLFLRRRGVALMACTVFIAAVVAHLGVVIRLGVSLQGLPLATMPQAMNMMILVAALVFIPIVLRAHTVSLGAFFVPCATFTLALIAPAVGMGEPLPAERFWFTLHTLTVVVGEALFLVATVASIVYLVHERLIRSGAIHAAATDLPPLTLLDRILKTSLSTGFIAITLGMLLGGFWAAAAGIATAGLTPKIATGAIMWAVFAFSLHQRFALGWQGRRTAVITIIGSVLMLGFLFGLQALYPHAHGLGILP